MECAPRNMSLIVSCVLLPFSSSSSPLSITSRPSAHSATKICLISSKPLSRVIPAISLPLPFARQLLEYAFGDFDELVRIERLYLPAGGTRFFPFHFHFLGK